MAKASQGSRSKPAELPSILTTPDEFFSIMQADLLAIFALSDHQWERAKYVEAIDKIVDQLKLPRPFVVHMARQILEIQLLEDAGTVDESLEIVEEPALQSA